jgi:hypothetical protein
LDKLNEGGGRSEPAVISFATLTGIEMEWIVSACVKAGRTNSRRVPEARFIASLLGGDCR